MVDEFSLATSLPSFVPSIGEAFLSSTVEGFSTEASYFEGYPRGREYASYWSVTETSSVKILPAELMIRQKLAISDHLYHQRDH